MESMPYTPAKLVASYVEIASPPLLYRKLDEATRSPTVSLTEIAAIIREDTGLCARLLHMANSPFYGFPSQIDSIPQALVLIGMQQLRDLVLATTVTRLFRGIPPELLDMDSFWRHSIGCGVASGVIARRLHETHHVERYFLGGVLHDIGRLVLLARMPVPTREILYITHETGGCVPLHVLEREKLGFDHADVGGELVRRWGLPASLEEAVSFHHAPGSASAHPMETAAVHAANSLVQRLELGNSGDPAVTPIHEAALRRVGLDPEELVSGALVEEVRTLAGQVLAAVGQPDSAGG